MYRERTRHLQLKSFLSFLLVIMSFSAWSGEIRIAVASNFSGTMRAIVSLFEQQTNQRVTLSPGSTGKHYAQIKNGAPFDLFFAADSLRPMLLEQEGLAIAGSRFTYAQGRLALWSPESDYVDDAGEVLGQANFDHLAIANPRLAPYGTAAQQVLEMGGLWDRLASKLVRGENIGQAFQFVSSGNAQLGFVAFSQLKRPGQKIAGSYWLVPPSLHAPIRQQAVLLKESSSARSFIEFVQSQPVLNIIANFGYDISHVE